MFEPACNKIEKPIINLLFALRLKVYGRVLNWLTFSIEPWKNIPIKSNQKKTQVGKKYEVKPSQVKSNPWFSGDKKKCFRWFENQDFKWRKLDASQEKYHFFIWKALALIIKDVQKVGTVTDVFPKVLHAL